MLSYHQDYPFSTQSARLAPAGVRPRLTAAVRSVPRRAAGRASQIVQATSHGAHSLLFPTPLTPPALRDLPCLAHDPVHEGLSITPRADQIDPDGLRRRTWHQLRVEAYAKTQCILSTASSGWLIEWSARTSGPLLDTNKS